MSVQDDYFDVVAVIPKGYKRIFNRFAKWAFGMEEYAEKLKKENEGLKITIKNLVSLYGKSKG